jgi:hypothetical protein
MVLTKKIRSEVRAQQKKNHEKTFIIKTPQALVQFIERINNNKKDAETLGYVKTKIRHAINHELIGKKKCDFINLVEQLLSLNKSTIQILSDASSFTIISSTPVDLSKARSLTIMDASANMEIIKKLLQACHLNLENRDIRQVSYQADEIAPIYRHTKSSFSRMKMKSMSKKQSEALVKGINRFTTDHGYKIVFLATYKNTDGKFKTIKHLEKNLHHYDKSTALHFGGRLASGHNELPRILKMKRISPEKALLVVLGSPFTNIEHISKTCYGLGIFKEGDTPPMFVCDKNLMPYCQDEGLDLDVATYKDPDWSLIHQHCVESQVFQLVARAAHRGIATLNLNNIPIPVKGKIKVEIVKTEQQAERAEEIEFLVPLIEKEIRKQLASGKATGKSVCKALSSNSGKNYSTNKYLKLVREILKKMKKESV